MTAPTIGSVATAGAAPSQRDILVIGGSAGAFPALRQLLAELPADLPASVLVVLHTAPTPHPLLAASLDGAGPLEVGEAVDGEMLARGRVYVARPDRHLLLENGRTLLRRGPRENLSRPAIDALFRSAAVEFGARTIGVVLSGTLHDGSAGLRAIQRCGGATVVQEPADAIHPDMPQNAIDAGGVDHRVAIAEMARLLRRLIAEPAGGPSPAVPDDLRIEAAIVLGEDGHGVADRIGRPASLTCPECGGSLWEANEAPLRHRCHVGHVYDTRLLLGLQAERIEQALWSALRAHEERTSLLRRLASDARARSGDASARRWTELAAEHEGHARAIRDLLHSGRISEVGPVPVPVESQAAARGHD